MKWSMSDVPTVLHRGGERLIQRHAVQVMHDQPTEAYLIPEHERGEVHLQIGRKLWSSLDTDELNNTFLL
jgi:hypothetical protein